MQFLRKLGKRIPQWLRPKPAQIAQAKVVFKAFLKGVVIAGSGVLAHRLGASPEISLAIAGIVHPIIKWIDPSDPQLGINALE